MQPVTTRDMLSVAASITSASAAWRPSSLSAPVGEARVPDPVGTRQMIDLHLRILTQSRHPPGGEPGADRSSQCEDWEIPGFDPGTARVTIQV
jgi:hypothetical protein